MPDTTIPAEIRERVKRGAELLDQERPGWASEIALDRLAMESCDHCILGQLYGDYAEGFRELLENESRVKLFHASEHGFTMPESDQHAAIERLGFVSSRVIFVPLAAAWRDEINARLAPATEAAQ